MQRPPRKPGTKIVTRPWIIRWFIFGFVVAATALARDLHRYDGGGAHQHGLEDRDRFQRTVVQ
jgi:hypothetical protein